MYMIKKVYTWLGKPRYQVCNIENGDVVLSTSSWNEANDCLGALERRNK